MALGLTLNVEDESESFKFKSSRTAYRGFYRHDKRCTDHQEDDQAVVGIGPRTETAKNDQHHACCLPKLFCGPGLHWIIQSSPGPCRHGPLTLSLTLPWFFSLHLPLVYVNHIVTSMQRKILRSDSRDSSGLNASPTLELSTSEEAYPLQRRCRLSSMPSRARISQPRLNASVSWRGWPRDGRTWAWGIAAPVPR
jgi:hypothetical protein